MFRAYIENENGERIELTNSPYFTVTEITGLLPPDTTINTEEAVNVDGSIYNSSRVANRIINITVLPNFPIEENRQRLYKFFKVKKSVIFYFQNKNRNVKITGRLQKIDGSLFDQLQTLTIELLCNDPYFTDITKTRSDIAEVVPMFEFPFAITKEGKEISVIDRFITQNIQNNGDVDTGLIIKLRAVGTVVNPTIYHVGTREFFGLKLNLQFGDEVTINTNRGNKSVTLLRGNTETNIINSIVKGNTWFTLYAGDNVFTYDCDEGAANLYITFEHSNQYEGV